MAYSYQELIGFLNQNRPAPNMTLEQTIMEAGRLETERRLASTVSPSLGGNSSSTQSQSQISQDAAQGIVRDANGNIIHNAGAIINETARAQDIATVSGSGGVTPQPSATTQQAQENIKVANTMLESINLKIAGKLPLTGGETYASLLKSKGVLEGAIKADSQYSGVSASFGKNPALGAGLTAFGERYAAQLAQMNPELARQLGTGTVEVRHEVMNAKSGMKELTPLGQGQMLMVTKDFKAAYAPVTMNDLVRQARTADVEYLSLQTGLPSSTIDANWGDFEAKLGKYSYTNLLKSGQKEAYSKGKAFVGGLGITLTNETSFERVLSTGDAETSLPTEGDLFSEYYLELGEGLSSDEITAISNIDWSGKGGAMDLTGLTAKKAGNILTVTKLKGAAINTSSEPFNIYVKEAPKASEPEIFQLHGVYYTKSGKTVATLINEDITSKKNELLSSNWNLTQSMDLGISPKNKGVLGWIEQNQNQIFNVPREFSIEALTMLGTKSAIELYHTGTAMKLSTELQLKRAFGGNLTTEETEALPRIYEEARIGAFEGLTEPTKLYVFNKVFQAASSKVGEYTGNAITNMIGAKAASRLVLSAGSEMEIGALNEGNKFILGQFGKAVTQTLGNVALVGSGSLAGVTIETDESGGTSFSFNAPRAVGGVVTMGGFMLAANAVTSIGKTGWDWSFGQLGTANNKLPNPFVKTSLVNIKEGEARALTGQNTAAELEVGKLQAKGEANNLIAAQKIARSDALHYGELASQADSYSKWGYQYKADVANAKVQSLQTAINQYVKQPESVSIMQGMAKQKTGLFGEFKWGESITTTVSKPDAFGKMASTSTTVFKPFAETGTQTIQLGNLVLSYDTGSIFGFKYPIAFNKPFFALPSAPIGTFSTIDFPEVPTRISGSTSGSLVGSGGSSTMVGTLTRLPTTISVVIPPRITTISKTAAASKITAKAALSLTTVTKITPKVETRAKANELTISKVNVKQREWAKYSMNMGLTEKVQTKTNTKENVRENVRSLVKEQIAERSLIRQQVQTRIATRTLVRTRLAIKTPTKLFPKLATRGNMKIGSLGNLSFNAKGRRKGDRYAYADLLNVSKSQLLYGKGTSPSKAHWQTQEAIGKYNYRLQTAEQLKFGKNKGNVNKFGASKWNGGLEL